MVVNRHVVHMSDGWCERGCTIGGHGAVVFVLVVASVRLAIVVNIESATGKSMTARGGNVDRPREKLECPKATLG